MVNSKILYHFLFNSSWLSNVHSVDSYVAFDIYGICLFQFLKIRANKLITFSFDIGFSKGKTLDGDRKRKIHIQKYCHLNHFSPTEKMRRLISQLKVWTFGIMQTTILSCHGNLYAISNHCRAIFNGYFTAYWILHEFDVSRVISLKSFISDEA